MCARYVCKSAEHKINLWLPQSGDSARASQLRTAPSPPNLSRLRLGVTEQPRAAR